MYLILNCTNLASPSQKLSDSNCPIQNFPRMNYLVPDSNCPTQDCPEKFLSLILTKFHVITDSKSQDFQTVNLNQSFQQQERKRECPSVFLLFTSVQGSARIIFLYLGKYATGRITNLEQVFLLQVLQLSPACRVGVWQSLTRRSAVPKS